MALRQAVCLRPGRQADLCGSFDWVMCRQNENPYVPMPARHSQPALDSASMRLSLQDRNTVTHPSLCLLDCHSLAACHARSSKCLQTTYSCDAYFSGSSSHRLPSLLR
ncbi:hypothetical protein DOTSEDRAFT_43266 [Dothistroma septosporum NZE10]|uniref:Uncharacterized protein n=1 Tax=Dothistroma septosporum (strain NZE10 / CBS 128990) TaxID=675120 RepID=N1PVB0_DOTSN|nr:hypothetical protein DOTSEDRAFT_43266 [Dothistroma septosporum NZE10]